MQNNRHYSFATLIFVICCLWLYIFMTFDTFQQGDISPSIIEQENNVEQNLLMDNVIPIRKPDSPDSLTVRKKRQAGDETTREERTAEITKSSQRIQFTPTLGNFYGAPESINSYKLTDQPQFPPMSSPNYLPFAGGSSFDPTFLQFLMQQQQQQQQQQQIQPQPTIYPSAVPPPQQQQQQPICYPAPTNPPYPNAIPFYCTYIPIPPPTYQFPVVPGIADFNRAFLARDKEEGDDKTDLVSAQYMNPYEHVFKDFAKDCPAGFYRCNDMSKCIPKLQWCDNHVDCPDASDEIRCSCRERIGRERLCDGYQDCPHGEDELGCFGCPRNSFSCQDGSGGCISPEKRCDGIQQCANGKDEDRCSILTESNDLKNELYPIGFNVGFLRKNLRGVWYLVCGHASTWAKDACEAELGSLSKDPQLEMVILPNQSKLGPFLVPDTYNGKLTPECPSEIAYVRCPKLSVYGMSNLVSYTRNASVTKSTTDPMLSIVGGHVSPPGSWPYIVLLNKNGNFNCGGVILNEWWILTAAHCFGDHQRNYYEVEAGTLRRFSFSPSHQSRRIVGVLIHEGYDPLILKNDLALGLLDEPLLFNSWVKPVRLPESDNGAAVYFGFRKQQPSPGDVCVAIGWGAIVEGGADPDHLREVEVPVINCPHAEDRNRAEICAGFRQGGRDACQGDSGGPLMCRLPNSNLEWYVGGIVSHGIGCGRRNEPGAYTKVAHFVDWIRNVLSSPKVPSALSRTRGSCPGFACNQPHGRCLSGKRHCDRIVDCLEAEDETNCPFFDAAAMFDRFIGRSEHGIAETPTTQPTGSTSAQ